MRNFTASPLHIASSAVGVLLVIYIALIAVVMSYASLTIEFNQSIKTDESNVAVLESTYLSQIGALSTIDVSTHGYALPLAKRYVPTKSVTALR